MAADQIREPPEGYQYAPPPVPATEDTFERKVQIGLDADNLALRDVYKGGEFVAGLFIARVDDPPPVEEIADLVMPGKKQTRPLDVEFDGREAQTVTSLGRSPQTSVIDIFDGFVLVVTSVDGREALLIADPNVR